jgi:hypothetical protein
MRGKLRDKHASTKKDFFKREVIERRRPSKRDNRSIVRQSLQMDEVSDEQSLESEELEKEMQGQK